MNRQARIFEKSVGSVLKILTADGGVGTGFLAREDGLILTARHVVASGRIVKAQDRTGNEFTCKVVKSDRPNDVAALAFTPGERPVGRRPLDLCKCDASKIPVGRRAIAIGNPAECSDFSFSNGYISASSNGNGTNGDSLMQLNMSVNWGNSGGPVILLNGDVCGMATRVSFRCDGHRNEGVSKAVPSNILNSFISSIPNLDEGLNGQTYCGVCGNLVPDHKYCDHCGIEFPSIEDEAKFVARAFGCPTCGDPIKTEEQKYCDSCGTQVCP